MTYETRFGGRLDASQGLALLIESLGKYMPKIPLYIYHSNAPGRLVEFASSSHPNCFFILSEHGMTGFFGKPALICRKLDEGYERVCWIDADILVLGDVEEQLFPEGNALVVAEEQPASSLYRQRYAATFGGTPKRELDFHINSCIISSSREGREAIALYNEMLVRYRTANAEIWKTLFSGDQEYLECAILNFQDHELPISLLRNCQDILHCRMSISIRGAAKLVLLGTPRILHAIEYKPWWPLDRARSLSPRAFLDCSPYTIAARESQKTLFSLGIGYTGWLAPTSLLSRVACLLPPRTRCSQLFWYYVLAKLPVSDRYAKPSRKELMAAAELEGGFPRPGRCQSQP